MTNSENPSLSDIDELRRRADEARKALLWKLRRGDDDYDAMRSLLATYMEAQKAADSRMAGTGAPAATTAPEPGPQDSIPTEPAPDEATLDDRDQEARDAGGDDGQGTLPSPRPRLVLTVTVPFGTPEEFAVPDPAPRVVFGRKRRTPLPDVDFEIDDRSVSSRHCEFAWDEAHGAWTVTDLATTNGTLVDDRTITAPTPLRDGHTLELGETRVTVRIDP